MAKHTRERDRKRVASSVNIWGRPVLGTVVLMVGALLLSGCPKRPEVEAPRPRAEAPPSPAPAPVAEAPKPAPAPEFKDAFFDFDKADLRPDAKQALNDNLQWLKANSEVRITLEGYADERGTTEYNLALGERRAKAVRDYLVAGGIDPQRISTVSHGEMRAFAPGDDESAWQLNRRVHLEVAK